MLLAKMTAFTVPCLILGLLSYTEITVASLELGPENEGLNGIETEESRVLDDLMFSSEGAGPGNVEDKIEPPDPKFLEDAIAEAKSVQILKNMVKSAEDRLKLRMETAPRMQAELPVTFRRNDRSEKADMRNTTVTAILIGTFLLSLAGHLVFMRRRRALMAAGEKPEVYNKYLGWWHFPVLIIYPLVSTFILFSVVVYFLGPDAKIPRDEKSVLFQVDRILKDTPTEGQIQSYQLALEQLVHEYVKEPANFMGMNVDEPQNGANAGGVNESTNESQTPTGNQEETDQYAETSRISLAKQLEILKSLLAATESIFPQFIRARKPLSTVSDDCNWDEWADKFMNVLITDVLLFIVMLAVGTSMACTKDRLDKEGKEEAVAHRRCRVFFVKMAWFTFFFGILLFLSITYINCRRRTAGIEDGGVYRDNFLEAVQTSHNEMDKLEGVLGVPQEIPGTGEEWEEKSGEKLIPEIREVKKKLENLEGILETLHGRFVRRSMFCNTFVHNVLAW